MVVNFAGLPDLLSERDEQGEPNVGLVVLVVSVRAYLLGTIALALPNWIAAGIHGVDPRGVATWPAEGLD